MSAPYYADESVTIYHGDCRKIDAWLSGDAAVMDPPYGMGLSSGRPRARANASMGDLRIENDHSTEARDAALAMWGEKPALVFGRWSVPRPPSTRMVLTWEKGEHVGMGDLSLPWKPNTEEIYVLGSGFEGRRTGSVLRFLAVAGCVGRANTGERNHPTEKPLDLMRELIAKTPPTASSSIRSWGRAPRCGRQRTSDARPSVSSCPSGTARSLRVAWGKAC